MDERSSRASADKKRFSLGERAIIRLVAGLIGLSLCGSAGKIIASQHDIPDTGDMHYDLLQETSETAIFEFSGSIAGSSLGLLSAIFALRDPKS